eukprot:3876365-Rhodomonas_salina.1
MTRARRWTSMTRKSLRRTGRTRRTRRMETGGSSVSLALDHQNLLARLLQSPIVTETRRPDCSWVQVGARPAGDSARSLWPRLLSLRLRVIRIVVAAADGDSSAGDWAG